LRFAGLYVSELTSSASASAVLSSGGVCFFGVYFAVTDLMVVPLSLPRLVRLGSRSTFVWSAVRLKELLMGSSYHLQFSWVCVYVSVSPILYCEIVT
jgi:hypothetical protein